ncbi:DUF885 family protein [Gluconacetobacter entanii]|uniref:DUF885 family protein n=1 Tax=Gluconacetobacter entanii TaxID=108528 RepID=A0ABT3K5N6_9PROT|nr:DUF885 family protein [Gluconacetobacter entanii]MCW4590732.1 DUF885 family protein [Gluconacetobacter entanii]MCW4594201.1 DUF885 family protein [Gluconacetobacter entanii]NPC89038.1 DUF885 family protein [Gluconacetobacter entanii]
MLQEILKRRTTALLCAGAMVLLPQCNIMATSAHAASAQLQTLFTDWRTLATPEQRDGAVDYGAKALSHKKDGLKKMQKRLATLDRTGWTTEDDIDARLIAAEMNGLDFDLRVRRPWARDPGYFATIFAEESDVPAHEGPSADTIDLFRYDYPLSPQAASDLAARLSGVPVLLERARGWLAKSNTADLWKYGERDFHRQAKVLGALLDGSLKMRTLEGQKAATLDGAGAPVREAAQKALAATQDFGKWIAAEAPHKTGPSGVGKANYDWYMKNVQLVPYTWEEQVSLLRRELERAQASLRLEELHNRNLPPLKPIENPVAYRKYATTKMQQFTDFIIKTGLVPDQPYYRAAMAAQTLDYTPPEDRNFFLKVTALDPWPLYSHDIHWTELARIKDDPNPDPIRRGAPLFNIYAARSEGFATAYEEIVMQAGLYDHEPRGRELVWIMLANRAARGLASLYVQANQMDLATAGRFHASWTPRGYSDPNNSLVGFEQLLYLRQPGYGTSYVTGKLMFDQLISRQAHEAEAAGRPFDVRTTFAGIAATGIVPWPLVEEALIPAKALADAP